MPKSLTHSTASTVALLSIEIADRTGKDIQLLPAGQFQSVDGRPGNIKGAACSSWIMDAADAQRLITAASARNNKSVIDYEHQTLLKEQNGQPAPAAGWFKNLEWREGEGLFAINVEWTPAAAKAIAEGEYRYISPVIRFDPKTGHVTGLSMAALTNYAGIDGMQPVSLAALSTTFFNDDEPEEKPMNELLKQLLTALGCKPDVTEQEAQASLNAYVAKATQAEESVAALTAAVAAGGKPDPAKFVPVETVQMMQSQLAALSAQVNGGEVDKVIEAALTAGKLVPAMETWARDLGTKDLPALKKYIETVPAIAALAGKQTNGLNPGGAPGELDADGMKIAALFGNTPDAVQKAMKEYAQ
jgi:phage I-like protein